MNGLETNCEMPHSPQPSATAAAVSIEQTASERQVARLNRLHDFQTSSLAKEDPLDANLGSVNSGLIRVALWLDEVITDAMESGPASVERLQRMLPAIDTHLRVTRQVDRFAQLELRNIEARKLKGKKGDSAGEEFDPMLDLPLGGSEDSAV
jgi:hypothetical protein